VSQGDQKGYSFLISKSVDSRSMPVYSRISKTQASTVAVESIISHLKGGPYGSTKGSEKGG
jgi:hypothetical protein